MQDFSKNSIHPGYPVTYPCTSDQGRATAVRTGAFISPDTPLHLNPCRRYGRAFAPISRPQNSLGHVILLCCTRIALAHSTWSTLFSY
ncbi:hypothetical protein WG66_006644 [Moniliophthora roreri]|nr:hypothetical protein WG66_006644 [Moniliophthora roreri]